MILTSTSFKMLSFFTATDKALGIEPAAIMGGDMDWGRDFEVLPGAKVFLDALENGSVAARKHLVSELRHGKVN